MAMLWLCLLSLSFHFVSPQHFYYDYVDQYDTSSSESTEYYPVGRPLSSSEEDEIISRRLLAQTKVDTEKLRYLMLDRKCSTLRNVKLSSRLMAKSLFDSRRRPFQTKNCWVELKRNGKVPEDLWSVNGELKLLVHGFAPIPADDPDDMINAQDIFKLGEEYGKDTGKPNNVITVDWTAFSAMPYPKAAYLTRHAGKDVVEFINKVYKKNEFISNDTLFWKKVHLIGFSLGAHVSGVAGRQAQQLFNQTLGRITGLDPAGPLFDEPNGELPNDKTTFLDSDDAEFVDIIHCNMGKPRTMVGALMTGTYGSWVQSGHADFYPNGGKRQSPFCYRLEDIKGCSHMMCVKYFTKSIRRKQYSACKCDSWKEYKNGKCNCDNNGVDGTLMGELCNTTARGTYYITVAD